MFVVYRLKINHREMFIVHLFLDCVSMDANNYYVTKITVVPKESNSIPDV